MTSLWVTVASASGVDWGGNEAFDIAVSGTLAMCSDVQYANTRFRNVPDKRH
jgi:hypothetical protein